MSINSLPVLPDLVEISEASDAEAGQFIATLTTVVGEFSTPPVYVRLSATYTNEVPLADALDQLVDEYPEHTGYVWRCIDEESSAQVARVSRGSWSLL